MTSPPPAKRRKTAESASPTPPSPVADPSSSSSLPAQTALKDETPAKCSCLGGWMSASMRWVLEVYISVQIDSINWQAEDVDVSWLSTPPVGVFGVSCIPDDIWPSSSNQELRAFLWGYIYVLIVILKVLQSGRLPTPTAVSEEIRLHRTEGKSDPSLLPLPHTRAKPSHYPSYARRGATVDHAIESILSWTADLIHDERYEFVSIFGDEPPEGEWVKQGRCETREHGVFGDKHWRRAFEELLGEDWELQEWGEKGWEEEEELEEEVEKALAGRWPPMDDEEDGLEQDGEEKEVDEVPEEEATDENNLQ